MDKQYYPVEIEEKWVKIWAERKVSNKESDDSFSQVIPPPNVTGTLHMGHSFQYAIMDFYTRYHHMSGKDSYWQVGSDHAGIATQMVVENNLYKRTGKPNNMQPALEAVYGDFPRSFFLPAIHVTRNGNASQKAFTDRVFWDDGSVDLY